MATSKQQLDKLYDDAASPSGAGQRIGPFTEQGQKAAVSDYSPWLASTPSARSGFVLIPRAQAAGPIVVVAGKVVVAPPPPEVKQIVVFNFPGAAGLEIKNFEFTGPNGRDGASDQGKSCNARGKDGEDAFRFLAYAGNMTVDNFTLKLGDGGKGGDATSHGGPAGNGGNCGPEGQGGPGGAGKPPGTDGKPGKIFCALPKEEHQTTNPPAENPPTSTTPPPTGQTQKKIRAIEYNGKYLPVDQLIIESEIGCGAQHYHVARGFVVATDNTPVQDPGPQCGYGKVSEKPVLDVPVNSDYKI